MRWDLWLAQPKTARGLRTLVQATACVCAVWGGTLAYSLWTTQRALADERASLEARRKQMAGMAASLRQKQADAKRAAYLRISAPDGVGRAEFAAEISRLCQRTGVGLIGARIGSGNPPSAAPASQTAGQAASNNAQPADSAPVAANEPVGSSAESRWRQAKLECHLVGPFQNLLALLDDLAAEPFVLEITGIQMVRYKMDASTGVVVLQMKLTGLLYGLADKP